MNIFSHHRDFWGLWLWWLQKASTNEKELFTDSSMIEINYEKLGHRINFVEMSGELGITSTGGTT